MTWLLRIILLVMTTAPANATEIIGHRGGAHDAPENTLPAFKRALEQGGDAIELDIHLTKDGRLVVIHDPTTQRTTGANYKVAETPLGALQQLDAGAWKDAKWRGTRIPALAEVLALLPAGKRVFIELKCGAGALDELARVMDASGRPPEQMVLIGFDFALMAEAKRRHPDHKVCWIVEPKGFLASTPGVEDLVKHGVAGKFDGLFLSRKFPLDAAFVAKLKAAGLPTYVWTVNDPALAKRLMAAGVAGLCTDRPAWLRAQAEK
jgi:glycerophosphoryl diester phosphodiesterase